VLVAFIFFGTAVAHMSCIILGSECYAVQMAPVGLPCLIRTISIKIPTTLSLD